jgi:hypothetical protein
VIVRALAALVLTLVPAAASACSACLYSAYGDRTFNWAFLGLIAMPFVVAAAIGGALLVRYRARGTSPRGPLATGNPGAARLSLPSEERS